MSARDTVEEIIRLDARIAALRDQFEQCAKTDRERVLVEKYEAMIGGLEEEAQIPIGLIRVSEMLIDHGGKEAALLFSRGLGHDNPDMRLLSGDALLHLAEEGLEPIMPAVEAVLRDGGLGAEEMPFLLLDIDHPDVPGVLERFLDQGRVEVVASAIEAIAEYGDLSSIPALEKMTDDARVVPAEEDGATGESTLGLMAREAIDAISQGGE